MTKLTLSNWFLHESLELPLDRPLTLVVGDHESGKSAIRDAIAFAWTGSLISDNRVLAQRGEIGEIVIRGDAKKATVQLSMPSPGTFQVVRTVTRAGKQSLVVQQDNNVVEGVKEGQAAIYSALGLDEDQVLAALDSWRFLDLAPEAAKALLFRALGHAMTAEQIRKAMVKRGLSEEHFGDLPDLAAREGFRFAEQLAVERRREAGRAIAPEMAEPRRLVEIGGREMDLEQVVDAEVEARIRKLREERDSALRSGGEAVGGARRMLEEIEPQVEVLTAKINAYHQDAHPDPTPKIEEKQRLQEALPAKKLEFDVLCDQILAAEAIVENAKSVKKPEQCEVFGLPCLATQAAIKKALAPIRERAVEAKKSLEKLRPESARLSTELDVMEASIERLGGEIADLANERNGIENDRAALSNLVRRVRECKRVLDENKGVEAASVSDLDRRISLNQDLLDKARGYRDAKAAWDEQEAVLADGRQRHKAWDAIAQALKPEGVESDLLREVLPYLVGRVNEITLAVGIGRVEFDKQVRMRITRPDGQVQVAAQLSHSAGLRLGIAIQHAIASLTGFPLLVVDELDVFNHRLQGPTVSALLTNATRYPAGVLGLATLKAEVPRKPPSDKVAMWWLRDGALVGVE